MTGNMMQGLMEQLPPVRNKAVTEQEGFLPLPDGVKLHYKLFMPEENGKWPVILMRNPYMGNDRLNNSIYGPVFARYGYVYLNVSVRGCLESEGEFLPFENEKEDGITVLDWISEQPWCDGNVGTMGNSYQGHTQWCVAGSHRPILKTMYIGVYGVRGYHVFYRRGMFRTELWTAWASQMMGDHRRQLIAPLQLFELQQKAYAIEPPVQLGESLIGEHIDWYEKWVTAPMECDPYWSEGFWKELYEVVNNIDIPIHFQGGWFDVFLRSQIESWRKLPKAVREKSRFVIEPYSHHGRTGGSLDYPNADRLGLFQIKGALEWFDCQLKGMDYPHRLGVMEGYVIREGEWRVWEDDIPNDKFWTLYLKAGGLSFLKDETVSTKRYSYDPGNPVESRGGNLINNNRDPMSAAECSVEQLPVGARMDIVSFVSEPLEDDTCIAGRMKTHLFVSSNVPATAFTIKVMEVLADGRSMNIQDDISDIRCMDEHLVEDYIPGTVRELTLELLDTCWKIHKGSRLRVDVSSSNYPAFHTHPNVTDCWAVTTEKQIAEQTVYCGGVYPSRIIIPIEKRENNADRVF